MICEFRSAKKEDTKKNLGAISTIGALKEVVILEEGGFSKGGHTAR